MPAYLNRVELIGNMVATPQSSQTTNKKTCATFRVATSTTWGDQEVTEYHECVAFGNTANVCVKMRTGDSVYCEGFLQTRVWKDRGGAEHRTKQIVSTKILRLKEAARKEPNK